MLTDNASLPDLIYTKNILTKVFKVAKKIDKKDSNQAQIDELMKKAVNLHRKDQLDAAVGIYKDVLEIRPGFIPAIGMLGTALGQMGQFDASVKLLQEAIKKKPDYAVYYNNLASTYIQSKKYKEALEIIKKAIHLDGNYVDAQNTMGVILGHLDRYDAALEAYAKSLEIKSDEPETLIKIALLHHLFNKLDLAIETIDKVINKYPDHNNAIFIRSLTNLKKGNFKQGWKDYESRLNKFNIKTHHKQPIWKGEDLKGKIIMIFSEQGLGDTINFSRYAKLVLDKNPAHVVLRVQEPLVDLLKHSKFFEKITIIPPNKKPQNFAYQVPILNLPGLFNTNADTIPGFASYIDPDPSLVEVYKEKLKKVKKIKVGLVWRGNPDYLRDDIRSIELKDFLPYLDHPKIQIVSLQKQKTPNDQKALKNNKKIIDFMDDVETFSDTAGIIANLDMVISVDTSVAHLSGAMGKHTWTLLPFSPDWRWLMYRDDTPWYPSMRLFRQKSVGDWLPVLDSIKESLIKVVKK
jgi:tetratricopeptide (TPR) repeat protein